MSLSTLALAACAAPSTPAPPAELRVLVRLAPSEGDAVRIAERVARSSGTPARYLASSGSGWHSLALECVDAACDAALARLREDRSVLAVQIDARKRIVTP